MSQQCAFDHGQDVGLFVGLELVEGFEAQREAGCFWASFVGVEQERVSAGVSRESRASGGTVPRCRSTRCFMQ